MFLLLRILAVSENPESVTVYITMFFSGLLCNVYWVHRWHVVRVQ